MRAELLALVSEARARLGQTDAAARAHDETNAIYRNTMTRPRQLPDRPERGADHGADAAEQLSLGKSFSWLARSAHVRNVQQRIPAVYLCDEIPYRTGLRRTKVAKSTFVTFWA